MRDQSAQQSGEVLEHPGLELVHPHAAGGVRRVDAADAVDHAGLGDDGAHFFGDVRDVKAAAGPEMAFLLEDLHSAPSLPLCAGGFKAVPSAGPGP